MEKIMHESTASNQNITKTIPKIPPPAPAVATFPLIKIILVITISVTVITTITVSISVACTSKQSKKSKSFYPFINENKFTEHIKNYSYASLIPKEGFDNILIFLGGISNNSTSFFDFFKNNEETFVPEKTKIICLSGSMKIVQYMIDYYNIETPVPAWFNIDKNYSLIYEGNDPYIEAKNSKEFILDQIDEIVKEVNYNYSKIFLAGFNQGAVMTNYVMLNSRHELGGYLPFNGYIFDDHFSTNLTVLHNLNNEQIEILDNRKDYYICASNTFNDEILPFSLVISQYDYYFINYTNTLHYSFGVVKNILETQPTLPMVKIWLKERMGIVKSIYDY